MREIYTDGSCIGNPGPGGRAAILKQKAESKKQKAESKKQKAHQEVILSDREALTTNNQMELQAVIEALQTVRLTETGNAWVYALETGLGLFEAPQKHEPLAVAIDLRTDSNYVKLGVNEWLSTWKRRNRRRTKGGKLIENLERRQRLDQLLQVFPHLQWHRVKGHAGQEMNERVDELARKEAERRVKN